MSKFVLYKSEKPSLKMPRYKGQIIFKMFLSFTFHCVCIQGVSQFLWECYRCISSSQAHLNYRGCEESYINTRLPVSGIRISGLPLHSLLASCRPLGKSFHSVFSVRWEEKQQGCRSLKIQRDKHATRFSQSLALSRHQRSLTFPFNTSYYEVLHLF